MYSSKPKKGDWLSKEGREKMKYCDDDICVAKYKRTIETIKKVNKVTEQQISDYNRKHKK